MVDTTKLGLPILSGSQAQKHVTMNESLYRLDTMVQMSVLDKDLSAPPASPAEGDAYIVGASSTGAWVGHEGKVAAFTTGIWFFHIPRPGWLAWVEDENKYYHYLNSSWSELSTGGGGGGGGNFVATDEATTQTMVGSLSTSNGLGAGGATPDANNKLSVNSPGVLMNHDGGSMQLKVNKNATGDTASLLFQNAFSGRAEMGNVGNDDFEIKTSPDGSTFNQGVLIKPSGHVRHPNGGGRGVITTSNRTILAANNQWGGSDSNYGFFYHLSDDLHGSAAEPAPNRLYCNGPTIEAGAHIRKISIAGRCNSSVPDDIELYLGILYFADWQAANTATPLKETVLLDMWQNSTNAEVMTGSIAATSGQIYEIDHEVQNTGTLFMAARSTTTETTIRYFYQGLVVEYEL